MAKTTTTTTEKGVAAVLEAKSTGEQLKIELQRVVQRIVDEDDYALEETDRAMHTLSCLREWRLKLVNPRNLLHTLIPPEFRCPLSEQLMTDPVVIASGQTFDRPCIQNWLNDGHQTCPQTEKALSHMILIPNLLLKEIISRWCREHEIEMHIPLQDDDKGKVIFANADRERLSSLLEKLSSSALSDQKIAAKEIRHITKLSPSFRVFFGKITNAISYLVEPLSSGKFDIDPDLREDLIATIFNLSTHDSNKKLFAENPVVMHILIESLKVGSIETKGKAAAALFTLSDRDSDKSMIGIFGALKPLIELLEGGHPLAMMDAASAIFSLCFIHENRSRAVSCGAVRVIVKMIRNHLLVDELLAILAMLASQPKAIEEMAEHGAVSLLLDIIRENTTDDRSQENCIAILYAMCSNDRSKLREIRKEEDENGTISQLEKNGNSRAKRKANGLLERLRRYAAVANTA